MKILSIIIPSYNMEKYLPQCINSLLVERIKDLEIFVVNDGSRDNTLQIAKEYESKYPNSIIIIDKPNGNYGSCINTALKKITGKYVKVLDADDSFEKTNLDEYIGFLSTIDVDLVISNYVIVDEQGKITERNIFSNVSISKDIKFKSILDRISEEKFTMHAVTYNSRIFKSLNYVQTEGISYTDMEWMFLPMTKVNSVTFYGRTIYRYLIGREGQTVDVTISQKAVNQTMAVVSNLLKIYDGLKSKISPIHKKYLELRLIQKIPSIYRIYLIKIGDSINYPILKRFDNLFKYSFPEYYKEIEKQDLKYIPFRFILYWRKNVNGNNRLPLLHLFTILYNYIFRHF
ncbi:MAG: glycosyltransferase family 2 protein [Muribaculum sp.]|nr:glycosyltransferase family 2 protein [Muribaculum sp.]